MKRILLLRHGHAGPLLPGKTDKERSLDDRGIRQITVIGKKLLAENSIPDLIICSDALRTRQSADILTESMNLDREILFRPGLYTATPYDYMDLIKNSRDIFSSLLIIAHNPAIEEAVSLFTGKPTEMGTAALFSGKFPINRWNQCTFSRHLLTYHILHAEQ